MRSTSRKGIVFSCGLALFLGAIVFGLYNRDNENLQNKEYSVDCGYTLSAGIFKINAICVQQRQLPQLSLVDIVNEVWDQIEGLSGYYDPLSTSFNYYSATPIFKAQGSPYLKGDKGSEQLISEAIKGRKKIKITYNELAQYYAEHLSYFVADKDLTNLGRCTSINYLIALEGMDGVIMNPGDRFNANEKLSSLRGYCEGASEGSYSFYGGVCGMVSQLFRVSLINPDIEVMKRFPHGEWFVQYYGENVGGDDAAVYEYSKQFEIQNLGNSDIVFKMRHEGNQSILVAISWPTDKWVNISKENIDQRETAIHLNKSVYESDNFVREENFDSYYSKKTYEFR